MISSAVPVRARASPGGDSDRIEEAASDAPRRRFLDVLAAPAGNGAMGRSPADAVAISAPFRQPGNGSRLDNGEAIMEPLTIFNI